MGQTQSTQFLGMNKQMGDWKTGYDAENREKIVWASNKVILSFPTRNKEATTSHEPHFIQGELGKLINSRHLFKTLEDRREHSHLQKYLYVG